MNVEDYKKAILHWVQALDNVEDIKCILFLYDVLKKYRKRE